MRPRVPALVALLSLASAGCVPPGASTEPDHPAGLQQPTFTPLPTDAAAVPESPRPAGVSSDPAAAATPVAASPTQVEDVAPPATATPTAPGSSPAPDPGTEPEPAAEATGDVPDTSVRGELTDHTDDLRGLAAARAPDHADLRELDLVVGEDQAQIRIVFAGPAPDTGESDAILNVATYHDVTGDGRIDYEIWASLTSDGWGTSWFDLRGRTARFAADDDVEVEVVDGAVVLTFPPSHLGDARSGRWLASSEWGTGVDMKAGASATDDAPDERTGQAWPS